MIAQFKSFGDSKFGVSPKDLYCKPYFIDDSLAGRLHLDPKFKIFRGVIQTVTVLMVDIFTFSKWAAQGFFNQYAVLVGFFAAAKMQPSVPRRVDMTVRVDRAPSTPFVTAFAATEFLFHIVTGMASVFGAAQSALLHLSAKLTLKRRRWFTVHEALLPLFIAPVKEIN